MDWKELLEYLKNNIEYVRYVDEHYASADLTKKIKKISFNIGADPDTFYNLYIWSTTITTNISHSIHLDDIVTIPITPVEHAEAVLLWEKIKELFSNYHIGKINQFIKTKKSGPKSIEELDDNGNND